MALIAKKKKEVKKTLAIKLEVGLLADLNGYSAMLDSPRDHVLSSIVKYVIDRDKDYAAYKAAQSNGHANGVAAGKAGK